MRRRGQRGVAIVELAIVAPVLLLIMLGMAEFGVGWVGSSRVESSASTAARVASSSGASTDADRNVLLSLRASLPADLLANVERVIIFKSNVNGDMAGNCRTVSPGGGVGTGAGTAGAADRCNTYTGAQLRTVTSSGAFTTGSFWLPSTRRDHLSGPPDYIGVMVITRQDSLTDTFWSDRQIVQSSVYRIAPDIDG